MGNFARGCFRLKFVALTAQQGRMAGMIRNSENE
jgi:hypothetical protein